MNNQNLPQFRGGIPTPAEWRQTLEFIKTLVITDSPGVNKSVTAQGTTLSIKGIGNKSSSTDTSDVRWQ